MTVKEFFKYCDCDVLIQDTDGDTLVKVYKDFSYLLNDIILDSDVFTIVSFDNRTICLVIDWRD